MTELSDEKIDRLAQRIAERLLSSPAFQDGEGLCNLAELSHFLKASIPWIKSSIETEGLPHIKMGQGYRFRKAEVMQWIKDRKL